MCVSEFFAGLREFHVSTVKQGRLGAVWQIKLLGGGGAGNRGAFVRCPFDQVGAGFDAPRAEVAAGGGSYFYFPSFGVPMSDMLNLLFGLVGSVPASYSEALSAPSPSESASGSMPQSSK